MNETITTRSIWNYASILCRLKTLVIEVNWIGIYLVILEKLCASCYASIVNLVLSETAFREIISLNIQ